MSILSEANLVSDNPCWDPHTLTLPCTLHPQGTHFWQPVHIEHRKATYSHLHHWHCLWCYLCKSKLRNSVFLVLMLDSTFTCRILRLSTALTDKKWGDWTPTHNFLVLYAWIMEISHFYLGNYRNRCSTCSLYEKKKSVKQPQFITVYYWIICWSLDTPSFVYEFIINLFLTYGHKGDTNDRGFVQCNNRTSHSTERRFTLVYHGLVGWNGASVATLAWLRIVWLVEPCV